MSNKTLYILSAILGLLLGISGSTWLFPHSWLALVPWALAGLLIGWRAGKRRIALRAGALYGFVLPIAFMFAGYSGPKELGRYFNVGAFSLILGAIGIVCGMILAFIGNHFRKGGNA